MHITNLRKVGGSVMLAVPRTLLDLLRLEPGARVGLTVDRGRLVVQPQQRPRYGLEELLAKCNPKARRGGKDRDWLAGKAVGDELI